MQNDTIEKLTTARVGLLLKHPFFGNMSTRMKLIDSSEWCPTAATNGRDFFYNKEFIDKLSVPKVMFLLAHEICHGIFDHFGRLGSRDKQLSNIAQDYAVNQILVDNQIGEKITEVDICQDNKYRGMAFEEIYDALIEEHGDPEENRKAMMDALGDMLDEHLEEAIGDSKDEKDEKGRPTISKNELEKISDEIKQAMIQAHQAAGAGNTPAGIEKLIKDLIEPKMDWREVLRMNIQSLIKNDYSFQRPSRKGWGTGVVLPGMMNDETIEVAIALDMSGSIGKEDARTFLSEVKGILDQYSDFSIHLWTFDTEVHNPVEITHDNVDEFYNYQIKGGGGTSFEANWDFMKDEDITPKKFIMFTDGYPNSGWGDPEYCSTLFIIKGHYDSNIQAPFGESVVYESLS